MCCSTAATSTPRKGTPPRLTTWRNASEDDEVQLMDIRPWDAADYLEEVEDVVAYLEAAFEDGDPQLIAAALGDVARSRGMTKVASTAGLGRESLYKALSPDGNPALATALKVVRALGLRVRVTRPISKPVPITGQQYRRLVADARAFSQAARLIEGELRRLGVRPGDTAPLGGSTGWPRHEVWESLKSASHFNFGVAFELRMKCLLSLLDVARNTGPTGHSLAKLYEQLPDKYAKRLEDLYQEVLHHEPIGLEAFVNTTTPRTPSAPGNREVNTLRGFCRYLDRDVRLWEKRYAHENVSKHVWRHYVADLDVLVALLDKIEPLGTELARKRGLIG